MGLYVRIPPEGVPLEEIVYDALLEALKMSNYIQADAARILSISPNKVSRTAKKLGIQFPADISERRKELGRAGGRRRKP